MLTKTKIAFAAALILGSTASVALARGYGGPVQTWCDIDPNCNGWNARMHELSRDSARNSYGYAVSRHHTSHAR
jgi:hypothetical protein